jgi:hypothetical protein
VERLRLTGLHAEAKPIFTLVAYRRTAKFSDNQTKRGGNSYEDREHKRDPHGRRVELPAPNHGNRHQHRAILYDIYNIFRNFLSGMGFGGVKEKLRLWFGFQVTSVTMSWLVKIWLRSRWLSHPAREAFALAFCAIYLTYSKCDFLGAGLAGL